MYFLTVVVAVCGGLAILLIQFAPYHIVDCQKKRIPEEKQIRLRLTEKAYLTQHPPMGRFYYGYAVILTLVAYLTTQSLCVAYVPGVTHDMRLGICIGVIVLVFLLTWIAAPLPCLGGMSDTYSADLPEVLRSADFASHPAKPNPFTNAHEEKVLRMTEGEVQEDQNALNDLTVSYAQEPTYNETEKRGNRACGHDSSNEDTNLSSSDEAVAVDVAIVHEPEYDITLMDEYNLDPQYQGTFWQNVRKIDLWLCWWNTLATWGCGVVISMNSAQIYRALNDGVYDIKLNTLYAAFIGIGSALGRMSLGIFWFWL